MHGLLQPRTPGAWAAPAAKAPQRGRCRQMSPLAPEDSMCSKVFQCPAQSRISGGVQAVPSHRRLHVCSRNTLLARTFVVPPMAARGAPRVLPTLETSVRRSCACKSACDGHATPDHILSRLPWHVGSMDTIVRCNGHTPAAWSSWWSVQVLRTAGHRFRCTAACAASRPGCPLPVQAPRRRV